MWKLHLAAPIFVLVSLEASGQIHNCQGVWTNQECHVRNLIAKSSENPELRQKASIVADLEAFAARISSDVDHVDFEAQGVRDFCLDETTSLRECRARALKADKALLSTYQSLSRIKQRETELNQKLEEIKLRGYKLSQSSRKKRFKN